MLLRIGIGLGVVAVAYFSFLGWLKKHDAVIYEKAKVQITRALQEDAAEKERAAIKAEESVSPTPDDPTALAALCAADPDCRDKETQE
jgi:hypothetical protein